MIRRTLWIALGLALLAGAADSKPQDKLVLVELFTSQG